MEPSICPEDLLSSNTDMKRFCRDEGVNVMSWPRSPSRASGSGITDWWHVPRRVHGGAEAFCPPRL